MFLWIIVVVMAVAIAAELFALIGMALTASRAIRRATLIKAELNDKLRPSIELTRNLKQSLLPRYEVIQRDGSAIVSLASARFRILRAMWDDTNRRVQRFRFRIQRDNGPVQQLRRDQKVVKRGVLVPIRAISRVVIGMRSAGWLLRKVA